MGDPSATALSLRGVLSLPGVGRWTLRSWRERGSWNGTIRWEKKTTRFLSVNEAEWMALGEERLVSTPDFFWKKGSFQHLVSTPSFGTANYGNWHPSLHSSTEVLHRDALAGGLSPHRPGGAADAVDVGGGVFSARPAGDLLPFHSPRIG